MRCVMIEGSRSPAELTLSCVSPGAGATCRDLPVADLDFQAPVSTPPGQGRAWLLRGPIKICDPLCRDLTGRRGTPTSSPPGAQGAAGSSWGQPGSAPLRKARVNPTRCLPAGRGWAAPQGGI